MKSFLTRTRTRTRSLRSFVLGLLIALPLLHGCDMYGASSSSREGSQIELPQLPSVAPAPTAPTIAVVTPSQALGGAVITIIGTNFGAAPEQNVVTLNGIEAAVVGVDAAGTQLQVAVPVDGSGTGPASVTVNGRTVTGGRFTFQIAPPVPVAPTIASFDPTEALPGKIVTISGTNFSATANENIVTLNNTRATVAVANAEGTQLQVTVPADGSGTGPVSVTVNGQTATGDDFTYATVVPPPPVPAGPTISSIDPASALPGARVTITGTNFSTAANENTVTLNNFEATVIGVDDAGTQLQVTVPANGSGTGPVRVTVNGQTATGDDFTYEIIPPPVPPAPTIMRFTPPSALPGATVTIIGTNFSAIAGNNIVTLNGALAEVVGVDAAGTQLQVTVPGNGSGTGPVTVTVNEQTVTGGNFTYLTVPTIASITPASAVAGTLVMITGTNFSPTEGNNIVALNGAPAEVASANAAGTQLQVTVPANGSGTGPVSVTVNEQTGTGSSFTYLIAPTIESFTPPSALPGATVTINGANFSATADSNIVTLNGTRATVTSANAAGTQLQVTVPTNGSGTGPVRVTVDDQTATGGNFTYLAVIVASFTPASALPGETVTIAGTNFSTAADNNFVLLNGYTAKVETATATQLTVTVPEGEGSGSIRITVDESTGVSTDDFTYLKKVVAWQSLVSGKSSVGLHTCGLRADGTVWCWGSNAFGQFGNGIRSSGANTPQQVGSDSNWVSLTAGSYHTCGLRVDDTAWCWGWNEWGVFGDGTTSLIASTPQWGGGNGNWISLSADTWHTCGIRVGGTAWCWGDDSNGKLGNGTNVRVAIPTPQQVGGNSDWTSLSAGGSHTCGVRANGTAWCWGFNGTGQLGILGQGTTTTPLQVGSDFNWASVSAADDYTCALRTNGTAWCWGWNANGQLGIGTVATIANTPRQVGSASDWLSLSVAKYHTCGVREDGTAWCWGRNVEGQLGNGTNTDANTPQQVSGTADWVSVEVGTSHTCGMRSDSTAWCWGRNVEGQLGNGTNTDSNIPVLVVP